MNVAEANRRPGSLRGDRCALVSTGTHDRNPDVKCLDLRGCGGEGGRMMAVVYSPDPESSEIIGLRSAVMLGLKTSFAATCVTEPQGIAGIAEIRRWYFRRVGTEKLECGPSLSPYSGAAIAGSRSCP